MLCPNCGTNISDETQNVCPNCGTTFAPFLDETIGVPAIRVRQEPLPGIYFDNLESSQEEPPQEEAAPRKKSRFTRSERLGLASAVLLLFLFLGTVFFFSRQYDPHATAITGEGGITMTNGVFAYYYHSAYRSFVSQYSESMPFDPSRPLTRQYYNLDAGYSWQDYFMDQAYSSALAAACLCAEAEQNGFALTGDALERYRTSVSTLGDTAAKYGYTRSDGTGDIDAYLGAMFGVGVAEADYYDFLYLSALSQAFAAELKSAYTFTEEEIIDFYKNNISNYSSLSISMVPDVNVRHILKIPADNMPETIEPIQEYLSDLGMDLIALGNTAEAFAASAAVESQDAGTRENGGLLEGLYPGALGGELDLWCFDVFGHAPGDLAVVQSNYGVHLVRFESYCDTYHWMEVVRSDMQSAALSQDLRDIAQSYDCRMTRFAAAPAA